MKTFDIKAGERRRVLHLFSDSVPQTVRFSAEPTVDGAPLTGTVEVAGSRWLFHKPPVRQPLQADNAVRKGMFDTRYSVYVTPDQDARITLHSRHFTSKMLVWTLGAVIVLAAISAALVPIVANG